MLVIGRTVASGVSAEASNEAGQEARGGRVAPQKLAKGAGPRGYDQGPAARADAPGQRETGAPKG
jgi:hypothetical protein